MPFSIGYDSLHAAQTTSASFASTLPLQFGQRKNVVNPVSNPVNPVQIPLRTIARNALHQPSLNQKLPPQVRALSFLCPAH